MKNVRMKKLVDDALWLLSVLCIIVMTLFVISCLSQTALWMKGGYSFMEAAERTAIAMNNKLEMALNEIGIHFLGYRTIELPVLDLRDWKPDPNHFYMGR